MARRKIVAVIGNKKIEENGERERLAFAMGKALVDHGYRVQTGGLGGVMEAVLKGARSSEKYREGDTVALVPSFDTETANAYADVVIPTGIDMLRNALVANADAVIGVGGGAGTLCEYAFAWS
ncbi:MAG: acyl-CoA synthetase, partial [Clostridia bacterium]|nr:acyl-CoA synthetase [Clostridia bacterium]